MTKTETVYQKNRNFVSAYWKKRILQLNLQQEALGISDPIIPVATMILLIPQANNQPQNGLKMTRVGGIKDQTVHGHMMNGVNWNMPDKKTGTILIKMVTLFPVGCHGMDAISI